MRKRLLSVLPVFCMALALLPGTAWASDAFGTCGDGVAWSYSDGALTIQGTGPMNDYGWDDDLNYVAPPWSDYRGEIHTVRIGDGVTSIGRFAFEEYGSLAGVTIPDSVTAIGDFAFNGCGSLADVNIPHSVATIGQYAFQMCGSLTGVTVPDSVTVIGRGAFSGSGLMSVIIPGGVETVDVDAFSWCESLTGVAIPHSVTTIGDRAFYGCGNLTDVYYGGSKSQWKKIAVGKMNMPLLNADIHYNSTPDFIEPKVPDKPETPSVPAFTDVPGWCADAVDWAVNRTVTDGVGDNRFAPDTQCTHAAILTFLWRADGKPASAAQLPNGAADGQWYSDALRWAVEKGMIGDSFHAGGYCTRADAMKYIWQAFGSKSPTGAGSGFTDVSADADYAAAVSWAVELGITEGTGGGRFSPDTVCNRGHIVTFLYRAYVPEARLGQVTESPEPPMPRTA